MDAIALSDFISGGYFLARFTEPGKDRPLSRMLPRRYLSASQCLCDFFPDAWAWNYAGPVDQQGDLVNGISDFEGRLTRAEQFGISPADLPAVIRWAQSGLGREYGVSRTFYTVEAARRAKEWVQIPAEQLVLFGVGLHGSLRELFLNDPRNDTNRGGHECVSRNKPPRPDGDPLGFELLNLEHGEMCHSWICNGLEDTFAKTLNISLNQHGYLDTFETAMQCTRPLNTGEIGAEPAPWFPWLIVEYH